MCDARVCVGGPVAGFQGWFGGIVEEAHQAQAAGKPLYVSALFGGAAAQVIDAIRHDGAAPIVPREIPAMG